MENVARRAATRCRPSTTSASTTSTWASPRPPSRAARPNASSWRRELSRRGTGRTLYLLDEPTTGLHFADVERLLEVLNQLVDLGNTVLVVEHHPDVIKTADHVIDLGPEGGEKGGEIVVEGTPEAVAQHPMSHTGRALAPVLFGDQGRTT